MQLAVKQSPGALSSHGERGYEYHYIDGAAVALNYFAAA